MSFENTIHLTSDDIRVCSAFGALYPNPRRVRPDLVISRLRAYLTDKYGSIDRVNFGVGVHSFTIIGEYVFFYDDGYPISSYHAVDDMWEALLAFRIIFDHESAQSTELITIHGKTSFRSYSTSCGSGLSLRMAMAAETAL